MMNSSQMSDLKMCSACRRRMIHVVHICCSIAGYELQSCTTVVVVFHPFFLPRTLLEFFSGVISLTYNAFVSTRMRRNIISPFSDKLAFMDTWAYLSLLRSLHSDIQTKFILSKNLKSFFLPSEPSHVILERLQSLKVQNLEIVESDLDWPQNHSIIPNSFSSSVRLTLGY